MGCRWETDSNGLGIFDDEVFDRLSDINGNSSNKEIISVFLKLKERNNTKNHLWRCLAFVYEFRKEYVDVPLQIIHEAAKIWDILGPCTLSSMGFCNSEQSLLDKPFAEALSKYCPVRPIDRLALRLNEKDANN